jgi:hypothetical protein
MTADAPTSRTTYVQWGYAPWTCNSCGTTTQISPQTVGYHGEWVAIAIANPLRTSDPEWKYLCAGCASRVRGALAHRPATPLAPATPAEPTKQPTKRAPARPRTKRAKETTR